MREYSKRSNETLDEYKIRLYTNKVAYGLSNQEIGDILNKETGQKLDESAYRKPVQNVLKYANIMKEHWFNLGVKSAIENPDMATDTIFDIYYEKEKNLYKKEQLLRDKLRETRKLWRVESRADNLKKVVLDYVSEINDVAPIEPVSSTRIIELMNEKRDGVAVLSLSDWHFGEKIDSFLGKYNKDIFDKMIQKIVEDTIMHCTHNKIKTLKVINMGDLMSGMIHVSTRVSNEEDIVAQTTYVAEKIAMMMNEFSYHIPEVELYSTVDNHGRVNLKYTDHLEKESFALFVPVIVGARISHLPNVKVVDNYIDGIREYDVGVMDIYDRKAIFVHGHNDNLSPNKLKDLILMSRVVDPICVFMGHYHKNYEDEIHGIDIIVNPALVPTGAYAKQIRASGQSRQKLTIFKKSNNSVYREMTVFINLEGVWKNE